MGLIFSEVTMLANDIFLEFASGMQLTRALNKKGLTDKQRTAIKQKLAYKDQQTIIIANKTKQDIREGKTVLDNKQKPGKQYSIHTAGAIVKEGGYVDGTELYDAKKKAAKSIIKKGVIKGSLASNIKDFEVTNKRKYKNYLDREKKIDYENMPPEHRDKEMWSALHIDPDERYVNPSKAQKQFEKNKKTRKGFIPRSISTSRMHKMEDGDLAGWKGPVKFLVPRGISKSSPVLDDLKEYGTHNKRDSNSIYTENTPNGASSEDRLYPKKRAHYDQNGEDAKSLGGMKMTLNKDGSVYRGGKNKPDTYEEGKKSKLNLLSHHL